MNARRPWMPIIPLESDVTGNHPRSTQRQGRGHLSQTMTEILDASHEVLDLSEHILEMLERATDGKTAGLLAIHAAARWRRSSVRLLRALDAAIGGSRP